MKNIKEYISEAYADSYLGKDTCDNIVDALKNALKEEFNACVPFLIGIVVTIIAFIVTIFDNASAIVNITNINANAMIQNIIPLTIFFIFNFSPFIYLLKF